MENNQNGLEGLIFPELTYKIIGMAFEVFNALGPGLKEKNYHKAMAIQFKESSLRFKSELYHPLIFKQKNLEKNYFDFLVEECIVVELKRSDYFSKSHFDQLNHYLKIAKLKLGLLISFTSSGVRFRRVLNLK